MDWRPENEVEEEEKKQAVKIMRRDEAAIIVMSMIEAQISKGVGAEIATDAAIAQAPKVLKFLDDTTPF